MNDLFHGPAILAAVPGDFEDRFAILTNITAPSALAVCYLMDRLTPRERQKVREHAAGLLNMKENGARGTRARGLPFKDSARLPLAGEKSVVIVDASQPTAKDVVWIVDRLTQQNSLQTIAEYEVNEKGAA